MNNFTIYCPPYYENIHFCITENRDEARKYILDTFKVDVGEKHETVNGYCISTNEVTAIWLPKIPESSVDFGALHHEMYHAVCGILEKKGVKDRGEPYAYLLGYIINIFYTLYPPIRQHDFKLFGKKIWIE